MSALDRSGPRCAKWSGLNVRSQQQSVLKSITAFLLQSMQRPLFQSIGGLHNSSTKHQRSK